MGEVRLIEFKLQRGQTLILDFLGLDVCFFAFRFESEIRPHLQRSARFQVQIFNIGNLVCFALYINNIQWFQIVYLLVLTGLRKL